MKGGSKSDENECWEKIYSFEISKKSRRNLEEILTNSNQTGKQSQNRIDPEHRGVRTRKVWRWQFQWDQTRIVKKISESASNSIDRKNAEIFDFYPHKVRPGLMRNFLGDNEKNSFSFGRKNKPLEQIQVCIYEANCVNKKFIFLKTLFT